METIQGATDLLYDGPRDEIPIDILSYFLFSNHRGAVSDRFAKNIRKAFQNWNIPLETQKIRNLPYFSETLTKTADALVTGSTPSKLPGTCNKELKSGAVLLSLSISNNVGRKSLSVMLRLTNAPYWN